MISPNPLTTTIRDWVRFPQGNCKTWRFSSELSAHKSPLKRSLKSDAISRPVINGEAVEPMALPAGAFRAQRLDAIKWKGVRVEEPLKASDHLPEGVLFAVIRRKYRANYYSLLVILSKLLRITSKAY